MIITWIIYIVIGLILLFVLYLALLGVNRGVKAKKINTFKNNTKPSKKN